MFSWPDRESWVIPGVNGSTHPHSASLWQHWCGQKPSLFSLCLLYSKYLSACGFLYGTAEQVASVCLCMRGELLCSHQQHLGHHQTQLCYQEAEVQADSSATRLCYTVRYYKLHLYFHEHNNCSFRSNYCILDLDLPVSPLPQAFLHSPVQQWGQSLYPHHPSRITTKVSYNNHVCLWTIASAWS